MVQSEMVLIPRQITFPERDCVYIKRELPTKTMKAESAPKHSIKSDNSTPRRVVNVLAK